MTLNLTLVFSVDIRSSAEIAFGFPPRLRGETCPWFPCADTVRLGSCSTSEADDFAAVAFRWPAGAGRIEILHCPALFCGLQAQLAALLGLAVEGLSNRGRAAYLAEKQDL